MAAAQLAVAEAGAASTSAAPSGTQHHWRRGSRSSHACRGWGCRTRPPALQLAQPQLLLRQDTRPLAQPQPQQLVITLLLVAGVTMTLPC